MYPRFDQARALSKLAGVGALALLAITLVTPAGAQENSTSAYGGLLADRSTLTGDWGGARDILAAHGVTIAPALTGFGEAPTTGNADHAFDVGGKAEFILNVDGSKLGLWNGFGMQVHGEYNFGQTPGSVGGTTYPNNTAMTFPYLNMPGGDLSSVFLSQRFGPNLTILVGKMNMLDFFANGHQFSGGRGIESFWGISFVGPPSGMVPVAIFGAVASYKIDRLTLTGMVYDPNSALNRTGFEDPFSRGVTLRGSADLSNNLFGLPRTDTLAAAFSNELGTDYTTLPYFGAYNTPELRRALIQNLIINCEFLQNCNPFPPGVGEKAGRYWVGYSFEQTLVQSPSDRSKAWGLFGQIATSDGNPNALKWSTLGGVGGVSPIPGRSDDKFGIGLFYYGYTKELKQRLTPVINLGDEYGAEVFYNFAVTKWLRVSADAQVMAPAVKSQLVGLPPALVTNSAVIFMGLRTQVLF